MTLEVLLVLLILIGALALFALEVFTADFVAFAVMALLMGLGLVTPQEGISGFSNPATITVMAMFILSAGLHRTGAIDLLAEKLMRLGQGREVRQLLLVMLVVGPLSAFMNNTAAVAILIPFVVKLARQSNRSPSKLLIPLSYISQLAGVITLIGTSSNILTSALSEQLGYGSFGLFEFSQVGLVVFAVGTLYLLTVGRTLLPSRDVPTEITVRFQLKEFVTELVVLEDSPLIGKTLAQLDLASQFDVEVLEIVHNEQHLSTSLGEHPLQAGDILIILTKAPSLLRLQNLKGVDVHPEVKFKVEQVRTQDMRLAEVIIAPGSTLIGSTLREADFRNCFGASVLAISKHGQLVGQRLANARLGLGDSLLLKAARSVLLSLKSDPNFIVTDDLRQDPHRTNKIPIAVGIILGVVALAALGIQPILVTALEGCVLLVLTGCLRIRELHQAVRWDVIFLLAGIMPLGLALEKTGGAHWVVQGVVGLSHGLPPLLVLGLFYLAAMLLTELISNAATVILLVPIVSNIATEMSLNPKAFILAVMFAASTSFSTPVGYQTNTMVFGPGGYKFLDFTRVGGPLNLVLWIVTTLAIAWLWGL